MWFSHQQETPQEQLPAAEVFADGSRKQEEVEKYMPAEKSVTSSKEN